MVEAGEVDSLLFASLEQTHVAGSFLRIEGHAVEGDRVAVVLWGGAADISEDTPCKMIVARLGQED